MFPRPSPPFFPDALSADDEIVPAQRFKVFEFRWLTGPDRAAALHDVPEVCDAERLVRVLLDHQDGEARLPEPSDRLEASRDDFGSESEARLIQDQDVWAGHEGPTDPDHLLFAAAQADGLHAGPRTETREHFVDFGEALVCISPGPGRVRTEAQVRLRGELGEQAPTFRARRNPPVGPFVCWHFSDVLIFDTDPY